MKQASEFMNKMFEDVPGSPTKMDDGPNALSTLMGQIILSFNYGVIKDSQSLRMYYSDYVIDALYEAISSEIDTYITRFSEKEKSSPCITKGCFLTKTDTITEELEKLKKIF